MLDLMKGTPNLVSDPKPRQDQRICRQFGFRSVWAFSLDGRRNHYGAPLGQMVKGIF